MPSASMSELANKFYDDFKSEKLKGPIDEFVKLAFKAGYMSGHSVGYRKGQDLFNDKKMLEETK